MVRSSCHCGAVVLEIARAPSEVADCNCTICRRYGALWAYYPTKEVRVTGATDVYLRGKKQTEFHRCRVCGCLTHWAAVDRAHPRMGVNARMMEPDILSNARVVKIDMLGA